MVQSKAWEWDKEASSIWDDPCEESYYYCNKWKREGRKELLDLGCGRGRHTILFAQAGFSVTAVDLADSAIQYTKQKLEEKSISATVKKMDMQKLQFQDDTFDCIWSYMVISHTDTEGFQNCLNEMKRVLKSGGSIFITLCSKASRIFQTGGAERVDENTIIKSNEGSEKDVPHLYLDLEDIKKLFCDFDLIRIRHVDNCCYNNAFSEGKHYYMEVTLKKSTLKLIKLTEKYKDQLGEMIDEWKNDQEVNHTNHSPWAIFKNDYHDFDKYIRELDKKEPKDGKVPASTFFLLDEERDLLLGAVNIRHYLNDALLKDVGHIGDGIRPSERRKGYATKMVGLALKECEKLGITRVLMVCEKDNIGSAKSIIQNGGILENEFVNDNGKVEQRYWITLG